jgi:hypothetical protein
MLDMPDKTARLMAMRQRSPDMAIGGKETVFAVTYQPSYGGIICLIRPANTDDLVATSLTHVRVHPSAPFARSVADYQKHRTKKIRQKRAQSIAGI